MTSLVRIANGARARIRGAAGEIVHSLRVIGEGRPGDAEPDEGRTAAVVQTRRKLSTEDSRKIARAVGPEAIWGQTVDFVDVAFFERGMRAARAVCRIVTSGDKPIGTGFLISPRLIITNNHVIASPATARGMTAEFDYERDITGAPRPVTRWSLAPELVFLTSDRDDLDFTVVALGSRVAGAREIGELGFLLLSAARNKHALGDFVNIIQHPDGRYKEAVVRENQLVSRPKGGTVLHYVADTEPGSSGSPAFNVMWDVVALHHWGGPHRELFDERGIRVPRTVNEGIRASAIALELQTRKEALKASARALIEDALAERPGPSDVGSPQEQERSQTDRRASVVVNTDGSATWCVPLSVSVRLGGMGDMSPAAAPALTSSSLRPAVNAVAAPVGEAKLVLDEDYGDRSGYDPGFLQSVSIALPALSPDNEKLTAKNQQPHAGDLRHVLRYEHFSIIMNGKRRLAFYTATNIDGSHPKDLDRQTGVITDASAQDDGDDESAEAAELWFLDRRIKENEQTPPDLYAHQTAFDANGRPILDRRSGDHRNRMFQQGHLTRRQDPLWGPDDDVVRAHADTFHVTNRSPQVGYFNMGTRKPAAEARGRHAGGNLHWRALEEFVLQNARADRKRVTVFTGPMFDDEHDIPWSRGRADMKGFKAPREYWKLVLRVDNGQLHATALVADQSPLIDFVPELLDVDLEEARRIEFAKVAKYQVSVAHLSKRTGLNFGRAVSAADTFRRGRGEESRRRLVENLKDVSLDLPRKK